MDKVCGLKAGKKRKVGDDFEQSIRDGLTAWRDGDLIDCLYPGTFSIAGATVLDDAVIEQLATCGERITNGEQLSRRTRWFMAFTKDGHLTQHGHQLLAQLQKVYNIYDITQAQKAITIAASLGPVSPSRFYSSHSKKHVS